ncbi:short-chain dehydrogenase [Bradyrhizobium guangdongense]|uniref:Short-chain dehydrogenase n=1 Tax=Bradyrhizobium guangdongense TaxID=1325090 RepID=A0AA87W5T3_9BRAD|nr:short-chain dehydrogenase [Bradyrhizobium guangdongense]
MVTVVGRRLDCLKEVARLTRGHAIAADLTDEAQAFAAVNDAAALMGCLDGIINCVGNAEAAVLEDIDLARWDASLRTNLTSHYLVCRAALPHLRKTRAAAIVNVSALAGIRPGVSSAAYGAAKAGVIQFTKTLAAQLAPDIRVNCVCPGAVDTEMMDRFLAGKSASQQDAFLARYALRRLAIPLEIANLLLFLVSSEAQYITGSNYVCDGGRAYQ